MNINSNSSSNSSSNTIGMVFTANTAPYVLASDRINFAEIDEITNRLNSIAQRERQLLRDFTESVESILSKASSHPTGSISRAFQTAQQITCTVCMENQRDCVLEPCMHVCCCIACLQSLSDSKCPVCRTPIDFYLKLYIC